MQPRPDVAPRLEGVERPPGFEHDLLHEVLGARAVPGEPERRPVEAVQMLGDQRLEPGARFRPTLGGQRRRRIQPGAGGGWVPLPDFFGFRTHRFPLSPIP